MAQRYVSKELFHFVAEKEKENKHKQYEIFKKILSERKLGEGEPGVSSKSMHDTGCLSSNEIYTGNMVCFCDIPIGDLEIHIKKYGSFGISFLKKYLIKKGVSPIWYISKNSSVSSNSLEKNFAYHDTMFQEFRYLYDWKSNKLPKKVVDLLRYFEWSIFPYMKFFDAKKNDSYIKNYYMEREWRLCGVLPFENLNNINRIILPRSFAKTFRKDFPDYIGQISYV